MNQHIHYTENNGKMVQIFKYVINAKRIIYEQHYYNQEGMNYSLDGTHIPEYHDKTVCLRCAEEIMGKYCVSGVLTINHEESFLMSEVGDRKSSYEKQCEHCEENLYELQCANIKIGNVWC